MNNLFKLLFVFSLILSFNSIAQKTITSEEKKTISKGENKTEVHNKAIPIISDKQFEPVSEDEEVEELYITPKDFKNSNRTINATPYTESANDYFIDSAISTLNQAKDRLDAGLMSKVNFDELNKSLNKQIRDIAIAKIKRAKDLLDAGKMSKVDFYKLKEALGKYLTN